MFLFPDAELWATQYLRERLSAEGLGDVFVSNAVPESRRSRMVIVRRDGGVSPDRFRDRARLTVRTFAEDDADAAYLSAVVRHLMRDAAGHGPCRAAAETGGPIALVDEQPVRMSSFDITLRGADA